MTPPDRGAGRLLPLECQLLLRTAGGSDQDDAIRAIAVDPALRWPALLHHTLFEKAALPVARRLQRALGAALPAESQAVLRVAAVQEFAMLHLEGQLALVLRALHARGIPVLLLKGAALAHEVYRSFAARPMGDLDLLLLDPGQGDAAMRALAEIGWTTSPDVPQAVYERHHHLAPLLSPSPLGGLVELHREALPHGHPFRLSAEEIIARSRATHVAGVPVRIPDPEDLLLLACLHFGWSHYLVEGGAWRTFRDVAAISALEGFDWRRFADRARASLGGTVAFWVLRLARTLAGVRVPDDVLARLGPPLPEFVRRVIERAHVACIMPSAYRPPSQSLQHLLWSAGVLPRWSGHATRRPWSVDELFMDDSGTWLNKVAEGSGPRRAPTRAQARAVARYVGSIVRGGASAPASRA